MINRIFVSRLRVFSKRIWNPTSELNSVNDSRATLFDKDIQAIRRGWVQAIANEEKGYRILHGKRRYRGNCTNQFYCIRLAAGTEVSELTFRNQYHRL